MTLRFHLRPGSYGDHVKVAVNQNGDVLLTHASETGVYPDNPTILLEQHQALLLAANLSVDPARAADILAKQIAFEMEGSSGPLLVFGLAMGLVGLLSGFLLGIALF